MARITSYSASIATDHFTHAVILHLDDGTEKKFINIGHNKFLSLIHLLNTGLPLELSNDLLRTVNDRNHNA